MTASDEARKALEGVTPGPWGMETVRTSCGVCHKVGPWPHKWRHGADMSACIYDDYPSPAEGTDNMLANARFIAWSREGVPALLAEIAAKDAEIAGLTVQPSPDVLDAVKWGFLSAAPGEWLVSDIKRVTDAIVARLKGGAA